VQGGNERSHKRRPRNLVNQKTAKGAIKLQSKKKRAILKKKLPGPIQCAGKKRRLRWGGPLKRPELGHGKAMFIMAGRGNEKMSHEEKTKKKERAPYFEGT